MLRKSPNEQERERKEIENKQRIARLLETRKQTKEIESRKRHQVQQTSQRVWSDELESLKTKWIKDQQKELEQYEKILSQLEPIAFEDAFKQEAKREKDMKERLQRLYDATITDQERYRDSLAFARHEQFVQLRVPFLKNELRERVRDVEDLRSQWRIEQPLPDPVFDIPSQPTHKTVKKEFLSNARRLYDNIPGAEGEGRVYYETTHHLGHAIQIEKNPHPTAASDPAVVDKYEQATETNLLNRQLQTQKNSKSRNERGATAVKRIHVERQMKKVERDWQNLQNEDRKRRIKNLQSTAQPPIHFEFDALFRIENR